MSITTQCHGRFLVKIQQMLLWKTRMMVIQNNEIQLYQPNMATASKIIPFSQLSAVTVSNKNDFKLTYRDGKKNIKIQAEYRAEVLTRLYEIFESNLGNTYEVAKMLKTTLQTKVRVTMRLKRASFVLIERKKNHNYTSISKIEKLQSADNDSFMIYFTNRRKHYYSCEKRDELINGIVNNAKMRLGITINVVDNIVLDRDNYVMHASAIPKIFYKVRVQKVKMSTEFYPAGLTVNDLKASDEQNRIRDLCLTSEAIYEVHGETQFVHSMHLYNDIARIVRLNGPDAFLLEYKEDPHPYLYICNQHRDAVIMSILELSDRSNYLLDVSFSPLTKGIRFNEKYINQQEVIEYQYSRVAAIHHESKAAVWVPIMEEFIANVGLEAHNYKDKRLVKVVLLLYRMLFDIDLGQKKQGKYEPLELSDKMEGYFSVVLATLARIFILKNVNEKIEQHIVDLNTLSRLIQFDSAQVSYRAAFLYRICSDQFYVHRSMKKEKSNKTALLHRKCVMLSDVRHRFKDAQHYELLLSTIFDTIELSMCSGYTSTETGLFNHFITQIMENLSNILELFKLSHSLKLLYNLSAIFRNLFIVQFKALPPADFRKLQQMALRKTHIIQLLYLSTKYDDDHLINNLAIILGYMCEDYIPANVLLDNVIPRGILKNCLHNALPRGIKFLSKKYFMANKKDVKNVAILPEIAPMKNDWFAMCNNLVVDAERVDLIWNMKTRQEFQFSVENELEEYYMTCLQNPTKVVLWNYEEFEVDYPSLSHEEMVENYYLRFFNGNTPDAEITPFIESATKFMQQLHHTMIFDVNLDRRIQSIKALTVIARCFKEHSTVQNYPYVKSICQSLDSCRHSEIVRESMIFFLELLEYKPNILSFLKGQGIQAVMKFATMVHDTRSRVDDDLDNTTSLNCQVSENCLAVLQKLARFYRGKENILLVRPPLYKRAMASNVNLPHIVQMLLIHDNESILQNTLSIMVDLFSFNPTALPQLYKTGLFYFLLFLPVSNFELVSTILKLTHMYQQDEYTGKDSILKLLWPKEVINNMQLLSAEEFSGLYVNNVSTPTMIWNENMKNHLLGSLREYLDQFIHAIANDRFVHFSEVYADEAPLHIHYVDIEDKYVVFKYYLENFVNIKTWPSNFVVDQPSIFTNHLTHALEEKLETTYPPRADVDNEHISMCLQSQHIVLNETKDASIIQNYKGHQVLVDCLKVQISNLSSQEILILYQDVTLIQKLCLGSSYNCREILSHDIIMTVADLIHKLLSQLDIANLHTPEVRMRQKQRYIRDHMPSNEAEVPAESVEEAVDEEQIEVDIVHDQLAKHAVELDQNLHHLQVDLVLNYLTKDEVILNLVHHLLELINLLYDSMPAETTQQVKNFNIQLVTAITKVLLLPFDTTHDTQIKALKALSLYSIDEELQMATLKHGSFILLLDLIHHGEKSGSANVAAKEAISCLKRLAGLGQPTENLTTNEAYSKILNCFYPSPFISAIEATSADKFLTYYQDNMETSYILWNENTMDELELLITNQKTEIMSQYAYQKYEFNYQSLMDFEYEAHRVELRSDGIFIRFYIRETKFNSLKNPNTFAKGLNTLLLNEPLETQQSLKRLTQIVTAMYRFGLSYNNWRNFATDEILEKLVECLVPEQPYIELLYYTLHVIYFIICNHPNTVIRFLTNNILVRLKDVIYHYVTKETRRGALDMAIHEYVLSILYFCYKIGNPKNAIIEGIFSFVLASFVGSFGIKLSGRIKAAYVLHHMMEKDEGIEHQLLKVLPALFLDILEKYPHDTVGFYGNNLEYPEVVWNEQSRDLLAENLRQNLIAFAQQVRNKPSCPYIGLPSVQYELPVRCHGIYYSIYCQHPTYPLDDREGFYNELIERIVVQQSHDPFFILALYTLTGGGKHFEPEIVSKLASNVTKFLPLLILPDSEKDTTLNTLKLFTKLSYDETCIQAMVPEAETFVSHMDRVMKKYPDQSMRIIYILSRHIFKQSEFVNVIDAQHSLITSLIDTLTSQKEEKLKNIIGSFLNFLILQENNANSENIRQRCVESDVFDEYIAIAGEYQEQELFKIAPSVDKNISLLEYIKPSVDDPDVREPDRKLLFERIGDDIEERIKKRAHDYEIQEEEENHTHIGLSTNELHTNAISGSTPSIVKEARAAVIEPDSIMDNSQSQQQDNFGSIHPGTTTEPAEKPIHSTSMGDRAESNVPEHGSLHATRPSSNKNRPLDFDDVPPPPPPPPPPSTTTRKMKPKKSLIDSTLEPDVSPVVPQGRSALLSSIRSFNKDKLQGVKEENNNSAKSSRPLTLQEQLAAKMAQRRGALEGDDDDEEALSDDEF